MPQTRRIILPPLLAALLVSGVGALAAIGSGPQQSAAPSAGAFVGVPGAAVLGDHHAPVPPRRP
ncbi:hypothetical protein ABZ348_26205 [Streptomyces sp. NPDC005963]|uniref:hypothetical protein n=1 Tax=Streptomyces sp. NPDC005963 TaxID=3156721 RepID=UPI0033F366FA